MRLAPLVLLVALVGIALVTGPGSAGTTTDVIEPRVAVTSVADAELRHRVARAIYGEPTFWQDAARAQPPIQILVDHGRVTLTGTVRSEAERALARSLATGHGETSLRCELQVTGR